MLEMGVPVRIIDLAERMIRLSGFQVGIDIPIEISGVRPGEKLAEVLNTPEEVVLDTSHPYINRLTPIRAPAEQFAAELEQLDRATACRNKDEVRFLLFNAGSPVPRVEPTEDEVADDGVVLPSRNGNVPEYLGGTADKLAIAGSEADKQVSA